MLWRELNCVRKEIEQHLLESLDVYFDQEIRTKIEKKICYFDLHHIDFVFLNLLQLRDSVFDVHQTEVGCEA